MINQSTVWEWLTSFPTGVSIVLGILLVLILAALSILPIEFIKFFNALERRTCKRGSFGVSMGTWPSWATLVATYWVAIPAAIRLWKQHNRILPGGKPAPFTLIGIDLSNSADISLYAHRFGRLWYVPILACAVVFLLRWGKFKTRRDAVKFLVFQLVFTNLLYWGYGFFLMFVLVPVVIALAVVGGALSNKSNSDPAPSSSSEPIAGMDFWKQSSSDSSADSGSPHKPGDVESHGLFGDTATEKRSDGSERRWEHVGESAYGKVYRDQDGKLGTASGTDGYGRPSHIDENFI